MSRLSRPAHDGPPGPFPGFEHGYHLASPKCRSAAYRSKGRSRDRCDWYVPAFWCRRRRRRDSPGGMRVPR